uniref:Uncharacterized protein n=1 Tax=Oryza sativa subsp. japonica TaxID=39947 RepID=Q8H2Z1_ORYSJ|nr:hypothetical protein [Oryza sativa Japonica Group]
MAAQPCGGVDGRWMDRMSRQGCAVRPCGNGEHVAVQRRSASIGAVWRRRVGWLGRVPAEGLMRHGWHHHWCCLLIGT